MFKHWLKQVAVVLISLIIVVSPLVPSFTVRADDYKKSGWFFRLFISRNIRQTATLHRDTLTQLMLLKNFMRFKLLDYGIDR